MKVTLRTIWFPLLLWAAAIIGYHHFFFARAYIGLDIEVTQKDWFKVYWAGEAEPFSEKRSVKVRIKPGKGHYQFYLTNLKNVSRLRIDSHQYEGEATIHRIVMQQKSLEDVVLNSSADFSVLIPLAQVESYDTSNNALKVISSGKDPNFEFVPHLQPASYSLTEEVCRVIALGVFIGFLYWGTSYLVSGLWYVPVCMAIVVALTATMIFISRENEHPDERVHVAASGYYEEHWLPPQIEDPQIRHTYSPYGASRLNTNEIYYLFCGKFAKLLEPLHLNGYIKYRAFNGLMLFLVLLYLFRVPDARIMALPFLVSPQVWYIYSYCNSDGFALTVVFFTACQVALRESTLNRYLAGKDGYCVGLLRLVAISLFFGLLLLIKKNYWSFALLLAIFSVINWYRFSDYENRKSWLKRFAVMLLISTSLLGVKKVADVYVNGSDRSAKIAETRTELANPLFNPDTPVDMQHTNLSKKARGITLLEVIMIDRWFEKTFRSAFGMYGYFTISSPDDYYDLMRWCGAALLALFFATIFIRGGLWSSFNALLVLGMAGALIAASLNHSWTSDFQPQGRYLFPVLGMIMLLCGQNREILNNRWIHLLVAVMFVLSYYSYSAVALHYIPRLL